MIKNILVLKETREGESRVALTPTTIPLMSSRKYRLLVEKGAGLAAGFKDCDYVKAGAEIFSLTSEGFFADSLILRVKLPSKERGELENKLFSDNTYMMGFLDPLDPLNDHINTWLTLGIKLYSVDLLKSLSNSDPRNLQAAMSRLAGRLAFQDGLKYYNSKLPVKLTVIGTGPAALSAIFEAKRVGAPVQVFGRQEHYRKELEGAGILYHLIPESTNQVKFIRNHLKDQTMVITAARTPGSKAPLLIDEESLDVLPKGAVIVDLTVNEGGSVIGSKSDQIVVSNGITIVHVSGYPKAEPKLASEEYAKCLINLLSTVISPLGEIYDHELLKECTISNDKNIYTPPIKTHFE